MLKDETHYEKKTHMNQVVYSQIAVATITGTVCHLVKLHEDNMNGDGAWNNLCECYDGGAVNNKTSDSLR